MEALYKTALEHDLANWPCYRGRMLLWYGKWLRRQRRVAESRAPLRAAREGFDALAFPKLAESARQELRASGERSRLRTPETWDQLTPQELQIARMAAEGLSNREIGQQLYLSHRTVGYHLHRIFPKLGITSRSQLHAAVLSLTESSASSPAVIARFTAAYPCLHAVRSQDPEGRLSSCDGRARRAGVRPPGRTGTAENWVGGPARLMLPARSLAT